ncbi:MAG: RNA-binding protein [Alphaproteobacteria bacterium]|nr:RNA-binding protein [Alphaproteobacteria bacterium]
MSNKQKLIAGDSCENGDVSKSVSESCRKCIVTGRILPKEEMIRFAVGPDNQMVPDIENRLPGRGFWLSSERNVLEKDSMATFFSKAVRKKVSVPDNFIDTLEKLLVNRCVNLLGLACKAGLVVSGFEKVREAVKGNRAETLFTASDGADNGRKKLKNLASDKKVIETLSVDELTIGLGRDNIVHVAVAKGRLAETLIRETARLELCRRS